MKTRRQESIPAVPAAGNKKNPRKMKNGRWIGSSMMTMPVVAFMICVQILCNWSSVEAQPTTIRPSTAPCSRLMMKGIDDDYLPWKQMAGIYHLANFTADLFPVYKHESTDMYFYYNRSMKEFRFGEPYQNTSILVGAFTDGRTDRINYYPNSFRPFSPFHYMITGWYQYDPASQKYVALSGDKQRIDPICIADHVVTCSSGMVEFDDNLKQINPSTRVVTDFHILGLDYYKQYPGIYLNNRPFYTRMRGDTDTQTYLFYKEGNWQIGGVLNVYSWNADVRTKSSAMRPEHVLDKWEFNTNGKFITVEAKLRCRVLTVEKACDTNLANQCLNGGSCLTSPDGVSKYCGCTPGYRGLYCEELVPSCPRPTELIDLLDTIEGSHPYFVTSLFEGSVVTIFRSLGLRPSYWFSTCDGSGWPNTTIAILQPTTTTLTTRTISRSSTSRGRPTTKPVYIIPTTTTTSYWSYTTRQSRRFVLEWNDAVAATVLAVMVLIMQALNPLIIWCIIQYVSISRVSKVEQEEDVNLQSLNKTYQTSLESFRQNHPQPEEEYDAVTAAQLRGINEDYRRQSSEIAERKEARISKSKIKAKMSRVFSLYAYCTFWIFLFYVILVFTTRLFGGVVFVLLGVIAAVLIFVSHLIVLLEYIWSAERQYIGNLSSSVFAVERIESIRATQPFIFHRAECYHFETRTRTVTYTDTSGNLQTRMETYQEKVVTNLFLEPVSFQYWRDTSPPQLVGISDKGITKIKMTLSVEPGDEETRLEFDSKYQAFHDAYEHMDVFVDFSMEKQVQGFEKRLAAYTDNREKPVWVSSAFFMVASFLFFSWPYRWAFNSITSRTEFAVSKLVYLNPPQEDNKLPDGNNCCTTTGEIDSGGKHFETDSTAVTIDNGETTMTTEYVNATFNAYG